MTLTEMHFLEKENVHINLRLRKVHVVVHFIRFGLFILPYAILLAPLLPPTELNLLLGLLLVSSCRFPEQSSAELPSLGVNAGLISSR